MGETPPTLGFYYKNCHQDEHAGDRSDACRDLFAIVFRPSALPGKVIHLVPVFLSEVSELDFGEIVKRNLGGYPEGFVLETIDDVSRLTDGVAEDGSEGFDRPTSSGSTAPETIRPSAISGSTA
jgi:hypothetical protein